MFYLLWTIFPIKYWIMAISDKIIDVFTPRNLTILGTNTKHTNIATKYAIATIFEPTTKNNWLIYLYLKYMRINNIKCSKMLFKSYY